MSEFAIDVRDVSKRFRLAHGQYKTVKERLIHGGRRKSTEDFWALSGVSLTVNQGETVGILGRNGSGKSTLLKCICGILQPSSGEVVVRGKLAGLLELGAGFHPDLTGRENVYLNGSLLGMSKREVDKVFDEIVEFSELEEFIDGPVKFYSSGMYVRLGFAVAVNVDPDILVVDEVLAVGDERFQRKCIDRVTQFQREGRTILLVTHAPDLVRSICDRGVVLSHGRLTGEGVPGEATRIFREGLMEEGTPLAMADSTLVAVPAAPGDSTKALPVEERPVRIRSVDRVYSGGNGAAYMSTGDGLTIEVHYEAHRPVEDVVFSLEVRSDEGRTVLRTDTSIIGMVIDVAAGEGLMHFGIPNVPLLDGSFTFALGIQSRSGMLYDWQEKAGSFEVMNPGRTTGTVYMTVHAAVYSAENDESAPVSQSI
ncbi:MAG TPA: ABC transporter ATP-binding protein [Acidimicrobiales bacterium]|nr:ABC transporter ATP-binding protein [Acidimicrobiales bacterium]